MAAFDGNVLAPGRAIVVTVSQYRRSDLVGRSPKLPFDRTRVRWSLRNEGGVDRLEARVPLPERITCVPFAANRTGSSSRISWTTPWK